MTVLLVFVVQHKQEAGEPGKEQNPEDVKGVTRGEQPGGHRDQ